MRRALKRGPLVGALAAITSASVGVALVGAQPPRTSAPRTTLGPYGVESQAIIAQNKLAGTTAWVIASNAKRGYIEGFAGSNYASVGDTVALYVSTTAPSFHVTAYRMGWYQGKGAREVWASKQIRGRVQPKCQVTRGINMVSCDNWSRSLTFKISSSFFQGDFLLKLVGSQGQQAYVLLTIWDPKSTSAYLFMSRSLTEEGWNLFGGYSYYQGEGACPPGSSTYPPCNRARVVSFDRPFADGNGASDFLSNEYPLLRFMEQHGLDVSYVTDITVNDHPGILLRHRALLSLGHDETWTYPEREGAQVALSHGVNIAFLSAAAIVRHARLQASKLGPEREEVDYRDSTEDPLNGKGNPLEVTGNTWSSPPTSWPTNDFIGEVYSGFVYPGVGAKPFVVWDPSAWIFKGTGLKKRSTIPGVIASDIDHLYAPMPANIEVLGHSPLPVSVTFTTQGEWSGSTYSDMTYYTDEKSKGGVFDSGTVNWINSLSPCPGASFSCPAPLVEKITANLLWLFGQGPAGRHFPSQANWQRVVPAGS